MTTKIDLDDLELKARAALDCSPWRVYRCRDAGGLDACGIKAEPFVSESADAYPSGIVHDTNRDECHHHMSLLHAEHIVANEPRVALALIARIRELEAGYRQLVHARPRSAIDGPAGALDRRGYVRHIDLAELTLRSIATSDSNKSVRAAAQEALES